MSAPPWGTASAPVPRKITLEKTYQRPAGTASKRKRPSGSQPMRRTVRPEVCREVRGIARRGQRRESADVVAEDDPHHFRRVGAGRENGSGLAAGARLGGRGAGGPAGGQGGRARALRAGGGCPAPDGSPGDVRRRLNGR
jgi:hypothetical protein